MMTRINETAQMMLLDKESVTKRNTTSTFSDNLRLPLHRWFRFPAGFSALWVRELIEKELKVRKDIHVFDPFAGSGTVLIEGESCGINATGIEAHPFISKVARAKLHWRENPTEFRHYAISVLEEAKKYHGEVQDYPKLIKKCFPEEVIFKLDALRKAWESVADDSPISELTWLALASILRECSPVGTAPWQYVLPRKTKVRVLDPYLAFELKVSLMSEDMWWRQQYNYGPQSTIIWGDSREHIPLQDKSVQLVITSPPYANNFDYADSTRLEMSFFGDIMNWGDLQTTVRRYLVRSCTQHVAKLNGETFSLLENTILSPIKNEIISICRKLEKEREFHGGKKPYHTMVATYFLDLAKVWLELRRITSDNSLICFVIGDSAPYGIYVPVDKWLGELALSSGFKIYEFEKIRDRNIKWKNRKHNIPLHEGRLWVKG